MRAKELRLGFNSFSSQQLPPSDIEQWWACNRPSVGMRYKNISQNWNREKTASPNPTSDTLLDLSKNYLHSWACCPQALANIQHRCDIYTEPYTTWWGYFNTLQSCLFFLRLFVLQETGQALCRLFFSPLFLNLSFSFQHKRKLYITLKHCYIRAT